MSKKINDPLESAKVGTPSGTEAPAKKAKKPAKKEAQKPEAKDPEPEKVEEMTPLGSDTMVHPPSRENKPEPGPEPVRRVARFRVKADCTFSRNGHVTKMAAGHVISSQHYGGMPGIKRMIASGLQLEELEG